MITGTLSYDIGISVETEELLKKLETDIETALKQVSGVDSVDEIDSDLDEIDED